MSHDFYVKPKLFYFSIYKIYMALMKEFVFPRIDS